VATLLTDPDVVPVLPGSTFFFEAEQPTTTPASLGSTVFVPGTADWGPDNEAIRYDSYREFLSGRAGANAKPAFGTSDTPLRRRVLGAFLGEGLPGKGGAGSVVVYRQAAADAARALRALQNTTPADAIRLTARWKGIRGNALALTVRDSATVGSKELVILDGAREAEVYTFVAADIAGLVDDVNASSSWVTATLLVDGVPLANVAAVALAGGDDGDVLLIGDFTAMLDALEFEPFAVFSASGITDPAIVAALLAWKDDVAGRGKPLFLAIGGPAAETFGAHRTRAAGYDDSDTLAVGTGNVGDTTLSTDGSELVLSTAEWVSRVAGAIARRGELLDMVNVRFAGARAIGGANRAQAEIAATPGVGMTVLTRDLAAQARTKIGLGVTTYQGDTADKPRWVYSNVKFVRTNHGLEADLTQDQEHGDLIGELGVNPRAADTVLGRAKDVVKERIRRQIVQPGSDVVFDPAVPRSETDDFVALAYDVIYVRGMRSIRNRIRVA
jgi:hypothetical protein